MPETNAKHGYENTVLATEYWLQRGGDPEEANALRKAHAEVAPPTLLNALQLYMTGQAVEKVALELVRPHLPDHLVRHGVAGLLRNFWYVRYDNTLGLTPDLSAAIEESAAAPDPFGPGAPVQTDPMTGELFVDTTRTAPIEMIGTTAPIDVDLDSCICVYAQRIWIPAPFVPIRAHAGAYIERVYPNGNRPSNGDALMRTFRIPFVGELAPGVFYSSQIGLEHDFEDREGSANIRVHSSLSEALKAAEAHRMPEYADQPFVELSADEAREQLIAEHREAQAEFEREQVEYEAQRQARAAERRARIARVGKPAQLVGQAVADEIRYVGAEPIRPEDVQAALDELGAPAGEVPTAAVPGPPGQEEFWAELHPEEAQFRERMRESPENLRGYILEALTAMELPNADPNRQRAAQRLLRNLYDRIHWFLQEAEEGEDDDGAPVVGEYAPPFAVATPDFEPSAEVQRQDRLDIGQPLRQVRLRRLERVWMRRLGRWGE